MKSSPKESASIMEKLRSIREKLSKKLLTMSPEERVAYINSLGKIDPTKKMSRSPKRPTTKRRSPKAKDNA